VSVVECPEMVDFGGFIVGDCGQRVELDFAGLRIATVPSINSTSPPSLNWTSSVCFTFTASFRPRFEVASPDHFPTRNASFFIASLWAGRFGSCCAEQRAAKKMEQIMMRICMETDDDTTCVGPRCSGRITRYCEYGDGVHVHRYRRPEVESNDAT